MDLVTDLSFTWTKPKIADIGIDLTKIQLVVLQCSLEAGTNSP